jgi:hypothetical protein
MDDFDALHVRERSERARSPGVKNAPVFKENKLERTGCLMC